MSKKRFRDDCGWQIRWTLRLTGSVTAMRDNQKVVHQPQVDPLAREQVVDYFHSLFHGKLERARDVIWSALVVACCDLYPEELLQEIERAYDDGSMDLFHIRLESVWDKLALDKEPGRSEPLYRGEIANKPKSVETLVAKLSAA